MRRDSVMTAIRWRVKARAAKGGILPTDNEATLDRYKGHRVMLEYARSILVMAQRMLDKLHLEHQ